MTEPHGESRAHQKRTLPAVFDIGLPTPNGDVDVHGVLRQLGLQVFERGWLSSNSIVCAVPDQATTVIDTGYGSHGDLTVALIRRALGTRPLNRIVNTHLHSDHCGGNAALKAAYPNVKTCIPQTMVHAVRQWDASQLTYARTQQRCDRFDPDEGLQPGDGLELGAYTWQVHSAPGHDPDALMLFEPVSRVLISGDALWERRLAVVFPELEAAQGFDSNAQLLDHIESLKPLLVIPGHGRPFTNVAAALAASRKRLKHFMQHPAEHAHHARRALLMFHMLEHQSRLERAVVEWFCSAPILSHQQSMTATMANECIESLLATGVLARHGTELHINDGPRASGI